MSITKKQERVRWLSRHSKNGFARTRANPLNPTTGYVSERSQALRKQIAAGSN